MTKSKTELKAKKVTEKAKPSEKYIVRSGSHSRVENGRRLKYECGDEILLSAEELEKFPLRFMSLTEYNNFLLEEERRRRADRAMNLAQFPPKVLKREKRDAEALRRQRKLNKARQRSGRRVLL